MIMNQFKRAQVVMLPTKKNSSNIAKSINQDILSLYNKNDDKYNQWINQNLFIISDEEIKEGDWYIMTNDFGDKYIVKVINLKVIGGNEIEVELLNGNKNCCSKSKIKKIIATTDTSLNYETPFYGMDADNNFPQPSQQFIEKYIESYNKGEVINDVLVEYSYNNPEPNRNILCLKVNSKDNTITIKKLKENWNREEVLNLLYDVNRGVFRYEANFDLDKFIEENL